MKILFLKDIEGVFVDIMICLMLFPPLNPPPVSYHTYTHNLNSQTKSLMDFNYLNYYAAAHPCNTQYGNKKYEGLLHYVNSLTNFYVKFTVM